MRVAFAVPRFPVISETFIRTQIAGLLANGHTVDVLAHSRPPKASIAADGFIGSKIRFTGALATRGRYCVRAARWVVSQRRWAALKPAPGPGPIPDFVRRARLAYAAGALVQMSAYDVLHCHFGPRAADLARLREVGAISGSLVTSFHGFDVGVYPQLCKRNPYGHLFRAGDLFLANSEHTGRKLLDLGCPAERLIVHPSGVDLDQLHYAHRSVAPGETIRVLTIARLVAEKGIEYSIRAVAELVRRLPDTAIQYDIAGYGSLHAQLQALIEELGVADRIRLIGAVDRATVSRLLAAAHIFVLGSVRTPTGAEEGAGVVLLEAQAVGLPIVATRVGGIPEMMRDGESGFLVDEKNVHAMADRLEWLVREPGSWARLGSSGRSFVQAGFDNDRLTRILISRYESLLRPAAVPARVSTSTP